MSWNINPADYYESFRISAKDESGETIVSLKVETVGGKKAASRTLDNMVSDAGHYDVYYFEIEKIKP